MHIILGHNREQSKRLVEGLERVNSLPLDWAGALGKGILLNLGQVSPEILNAMCGGCVFT